MKILNKICDVFSSIYTYGLTFLGFAVILSLTIINMVNTCFLNTGEHIYQTQDSLLLNILIIVLVSVLLSCIWDNQRVQSFIQRIETDESLFKKIRLVILIIVFALSALWVLIVQANPGADQKFVQDAVLALKNKDYSAFVQGGYISKYPNQIGFLVISYLYSLIFGDNNYIGIQIINAVGVALIYKIFCDIQDILGFKKIHQLVISVFGILFLPLIFYSTFVYGTILGLLCSLIAIKHEISFFKTFNVKDIIITAITIALAIMFKNNYLIIFVAIVLYAAVEIITQKLWKKSWIFIVLISFYLVQSIAPTLALEKATGTKLDSGITSWAWVAMGLQESPLSCGWYNGYNESTYIKAQYNPDEQKKVVKERIAESIETFKKDTPYAISFFGQKIASMWSEPTYESLWVSQIRNTDIETSEFAWRLLTIDGAYPIIIFLNFFQSFVLFGTLLYFLLCRKEQYYRQSLIFIMTFIGGFIFHLVWEAKGQYSITYYVLLFPYAIAGLVQLMKLLNKISAKQTVKNKVASDNEVTDTSKTAVSRSKEPSQMLSITELTFAVITICVAVLYLAFSSLDNDNPLFADTKEYTTYLREQKDRNSINVKDGDYILSNVAADSLTLNYVDQNDTTALLQMGSESHSIHVTTRKGISHINFVNTDFYIDEYNSQDKTHELVEAREHSESIGQEWTIVPGENGTFYITHYKEYALTYDTETGEIYVTTNTHAENQRWTFTSAN